MDSYEQKIREYINSGEVDQLYKSMLINLFPELKASEDERIRKSLIDELKIENANYKLFKEIPKERFIAWLEKQGEQKPYASETMNEKGDFDNGFTRMMEKEQKPTDKVEPKFKVKYAGSEYNVLEVKDIAGVTFYGIEDEPDHIDYVQAKNCKRVDGYSIKENGSPYPTKPAVFSEKKPAWSEEDKTILDNLIYALANDRIGNNRDEYVDWLKSLKDRCLPQQKPEWSEEDEQFLLVCKNALAKYQVSDKWDASIISRWLENRLKSLRPQNAWKPSEEDMRLIWNLGDEIPYMPEEEFYKELLKRYKAKKGE